MPTEEAGQKVMATQHCLCSHVCEQSQDVE